MPHNIALPRHRYVWVENAFVRRTTTEGVTPAIWLGVSVTPGRMLGCHVLLEDGAMVVDLPLIALRHRAECHASSHGALITWDSYGWDAELFTSDYLDGITALLLDEQHQKTETYGELWFAVDHLRDGFGLEPAQHKHLWVVALDSGRFGWVPQDQLLLHDKSFTVIGDVPDIKRQDYVWGVE